MTTTTLRTGITVEYEISGAGLPPPVLLLHAWTESQRAFDRLRPLLPGALQVISFDQRGHGGSDKPGGGYDLTTIVDDVLAFLEALDLPPAVVVGSSSGGYVAQQLAVAHPERVAGLALVGAPRSLQGRPPFLDEIAQLTDPIDPAWMRASIEWFPRFQPVPDWYIDDRVQDGLACPAHSCLGTLLGLIDAVPPTQVGTISVPTVILWGERDDLLPRVDADLLQEAIPDSRLVMLPDTGHLVLWEQPARVASEVMSLIERVRALSLASWSGELGRQPTHTPGVGSPVDGDDSSGDVAGGVRHEEGDDRGNLLGASRVASSGSSRPTRSLRPRTARVLRWPPFPR